MRQTVQQLLMYGLEYLHDCFFLWWARYRIGVTLFVGRAMPMQYLLVDNNIDYDMEYVELADWMQFREKLVSNKLR